jgi:peptide/nickel transport system permease protein
MTPTILAIGIVYTPIFARVVRASTLSVRVEPFVQISRAMGTGNVYILARHIIPNIAGPLIVQTSLSWRSRSYPRRRYRSSGWASSRRSRRWAG